MNVKGLLETPSNRLLIRWYYSKSERYKLKVKDTVKVLDFNLYGLLCKTRIAQGIQLHEETISIVS